MADEQTPQKKSVLIVEDDAFLRNILKVKLGNEGYNVLLAADGVSALEVIRNEKPTLILLDLMLPKKSGFEILEELSKDKTLKRPPILIISNLGQQADIERGKNLGAAEYFVKARLSIDELVEKVKEHVIR